MTVKCLSIRQPWAYWIVNGFKDVENRTWDTKHRGLFLIHAAKGMTNDEFVKSGSTVRSALTLQGKPHMPVYPNRNLLEFGGIVGACILKDVYSPGRYMMPIPWYNQDGYGFQLEQVIKLPFRPLKGQLNFFNVETTPEESKIIRDAGLLKDLHL